jgi:hypothetical protein
MKEGHRTPQKVVEHGRTSWNMMEGYGALLKVLEKARKMEHSRTIGQERQY